MLLLAGLAAVSCASAPRTDGSLECGPVPEQALPASATLQDHDDAFELTMVATTGPRAGMEVRGSLELVRHDEDKNPLIGWSDLDLTSVGAYEVGGAASRNPTSPGVRVLENRQGSATSIILRLGAEANQEGLLRFDGAYSVLRVHRIEDDGFYGLWESGIDEVRAAGYFCAVEVGLP